MEKFTLAFITFCLLCITFSTEIEIRGDKRGAAIRQKKKILTFKKPLRGHHHGIHHHSGGGGGGGGAGGFHHHGRPGRQSSFPTTSQSSVTPTNDYSLVVTSESPSASWKPITYTVFSSENPAAAAGAHSESATPARAAVEVSAIANGNVGHLEHAAAPSDSEQAQTTHHEQQHPNDQFDDYSLLQYYIPFEQVISHSSANVVNEPAQTDLSRKQPKSVDSVESIPIFKRDHDGDSDAFDGDSDSAGRYEYEYFVQDDHYGTNFGHKEYRDGKHTKGDYEVVLPDGRVQHVRYWSDASGYHASVTYHPIFKKFQHV